MLKNDDPETVLFDISPPKRNQIYKFHTSNKAKKQENMAYIKQHQPPTSVYKVYCISHDYTVNSTHLISMAGCTYPAMTWVPKHFLCSRRAWICRVSLQAAMHRQPFVAKQNKSNIASSCELSAYDIRPSQCIGSVKPIIMFFLSFLSLSSFPPTSLLHDNVARGRCPTKLPVNPVRPSGVFILSFKLASPPHVFEDESLR